MLTGNSLYYEFNHVNLHAPIVVHAESLEDAADRAGLVDPVYTYQLSITHVDPRTTILVNNKRINNDGAEGQEASGQVTKQAV